MSLPLAPVVERMCGRLVLVEIVIDEVRVVSESCRGSCKQHRQQAHRGCLHGVRQVVAQKAKDRPCVSLFRHPM